MKYPCYNRVLYRPGKYGWCSNFQKSPTSISELIRHLSANELYPENEIVLKNSLDDVLRISYKTNKKPKGKQFKISVKENFSGETNLKGVYI